MQLIDMRLIVKGLYGNFKTRGQNGLLFGTNNYMWFYIACKKWSYLYNRVFKGYTQGFN